MPKVIFNGKNEAERIAEFLEENERVLGKSMVIFQCDGARVESTYVRLKREMGDRLGVLMTVVFAEDTEDLKTRIIEANEDDTIDGLMVQLPIKGADKEETEQLLSSINPSKDIDGLNPKSSFDPSVVRAVERVIDIFRIEEEDSIAVVGAKGQIGERLMERLIYLGYKPTGFDKGDDLTKLVDFDVIIGVTGVEGLIKESMVKEGFVGIDLGYPKGDFSKEAFEKALMITPVPGGVGPLTIVSLFSNLAE